ncbi:MAG TPA: cytochrome c [Rhodocyclaceae bacterium]|nr:cytochrome c [Rhodocyclaceae bacterium]HNH34830.1 cytochrome c [Rhodocyclaceae bacterium]
MKASTKTLALGLALAIGSGVAAAQVIGKAEDQIRWRQSAMHTQAWSMGRIKANLDGTFNKDQVVEAANVIQAIANSKMGSLYQPGTDSGKGWKNTRVSKDYFSDRENLAKYGGAYVKEANEMAKVAAAGDAGAVKAQFGKLGEACKGCHDKFRQED